MLKYLLILSLIEYEPKYVATSYSRPIKLSYIQQSVSELFGELCLTGIIGDIYRNYEHLNLW
jgi:hypothetical protein